MLSTVTKSHMAVAQNASGRSLNVPIYTITSGKPGPNVYIQSSIHGSEVQKTKSLKLGHYCQF